MNDRQSWVAIKPNGFPFAFGDVLEYTETEWQEEVGSAAKIRVVSGDERSRLLNIHAHGDQQMRLW